jgi:hypothetical protein
MSRKGGVYIKICLIEKDQGKSTNIIFTLNYRKCLNVWAECIEDLRII